MNNGKKLLPLLTVVSKITKEQTVTRKKSIVRGVSLHCSEYALIVIEDNNDQKEIKGLKYI